MAQYSSGAPRPHAQLANTALPKLLRAAHSNAYSPPRPPAPCGASSPSRPRRRLRALCPSSPCAGVPPSPPPDAPAPLATILVLAVELHRGGPLPLASASASTASCFLGQCCPYSSTPLLFCYISTTRSPQRSWQGMPAHARPPLHL